VQLGDALFEEPGLRRRAAALQHHPGVAIAARKHAQRNPYAMMPKTAATEKKKK
jgi:hypothetical protein